MFDLNELKDKNQIKIHCTINYSVCLFLTNQINHYHACMYIQCIYVCCILMTNRAEKDLK